MNHNYNQNQSKQDVLKQQYQSSNNQGQNKQASVHKLHQSQDKYDFEIANELDKRQRAYDQTTQAYNAKKANTQSQHMNAKQSQKDWNAQQRHDLEIANELGAQYAANASMNQNAIGQNNTQELMARNYKRLSEQHQKTQQDVEFSLDLPNANKSMHRQALPNNNTANQFQRNKQPNYSNVDPETDSNRFEKGNN